MLVQVPSVLEVLALAFFPSPPRPGPTLAAKKCHPLVSIFKAQGFCSRAAPDSTKIVNPLTHLLHKPVVGGSPRPGIDKWLNREDIHSSMIQCSVGVAPTICEHVSSFLGGLPGSAASCQVHQGHQDQRMSLFWCLFDLHQNQSSLGSSRLSEVPFN